MTAVITNTLGIGITISLGVTGLLLLWIGGRDQ